LTARAGRGFALSKIDVRRSALRTAEQRIELFRSLFRGRDDVYAIRWESADRRSGYMPKANRDWKSYLRAKDKDRKKVDRQTRKFRPVTKRRCAWLPIYSLDSANKIEMAVPA